MCCELLLHPLLSTNDTGRILLIINDGCITNRNGCHESSILTFVRPETPTMSTKEEAVPSVLLEVDRRCPVCRAKVKNARVKGRSHTIKKRKRNRKPVNIQWLTGSQHNITPYFYFLAYCSECGFADTVPEFRDPETESGKLEEVKRFLETGASPKQQKLIQAFIKLIQSRKHLKQYDLTAALTIHMLSYYLYNNIRESFRPFKKLGRIGLRISWLLEDLQEEDTKRTQKINSLIQYPSSLPENSDEALDQSISYYQTFLEKRPPEDDPKQETNIRFLLTDLLEYKGEPKRSMKCIRQMFSLLTGYQRELNKALRQGQNQSSERQDKQKLLNWINQKISDIRQRREEIKQAIAEEEMPELQRWLNENGYSSSKPLSTELIDELQDDRFHEYTLKKYNKQVQ